MAARTAYWLKRFYGIEYSFTGHANDLFCAEDFPVTLKDVIAEAHFIVTETDFARRWLEQNYPTSAGKTFRVFNGIAMEGFLPRQPASSVPHILSVGRYVEKKGFGDLIDACALLRDRGIVFRCDIVGGGPLEEQLTRKIQEKGLTGLVHLLGPKPQEEIRRLLSQATVFTLACVQEPDGGSDNLPTVVMEAMAASVPVVSTKLAGVPEMITDGTDGLLVEPGNPGQLADAIARLIQNPALAEQIAVAGRQTAEARFAIAPVTKELKHLLVRRAGIKPPRLACEHDPEMRVPFLRRFIGG
jgi:glycosyltransferase involved in cell wall biosynthesis